MLTICIFRFRRHLFLFVYFYWIEYSLLNLRIPCLILEYFFFQFSILFFVSYWINCSLKSPIQIPILYWDDDVFSVFSMILFLFSFKILVTKMIFYKNVAVLEWKANTQEQNENKSSFQDLLFRPTVKVHNAFGITENDNIQPKNSNERNI